MPKFLSDGFFDGSSTDLTVDGKINISDYIVHTGDTNSYFGFGLNDYIKFHTAGSDKFYISSTSIGSQSAHDFLSALYTSNVTGRTDYDTKIEFPGSDVMTFKTGDSERIRINASGYVGINETNPEQTLHVAGNFRLENQLYDSTNSQGSVGQILSKVAAGTQWIDQGDVTAAEAEVAKTLQVTVKNVSGGDLAKGTVVHVSPSASPPSGNIIEVIAADYDDASKMPAVGVLKETIADEAEGEAVMAGALSGIATNGFTAGDELYVGADGALTNTKPQTAGQLIQKIAVCVKSHASNGLIKIFGAGRSNDVPLPLYIDNTNQRVGIGEPSPNKQLEILYPSYIDKDTVEGLIRLTGQSNTENSVDKLSAGVGIEFYNKWEGGAPYSLGRISARGSLSYDGGLQFDVAQNSAPGQSNFTTAMTILDTGKVGIGTTDPTAKLDVSGDFGIQGVLFTNTGYQRTDGAGVDNGFAIAHRTGITTLNTAYNYIVRLTTAGTGTDTGSYWIVGYDKGTGSWSVRMVTQAGNSSNHPLLAIGSGGNTMVAYTNHSSGYNIRWSCESIGISDNDGTLHNMGSDYHWQRNIDKLFYSDGNVGIGTSDPLYKLHSSNSGSRNDFQFTLDSFGTGATDGAQLGIQSGGAYIWNFENNDLYFATNNSRALTIKPSGNVGIGTDSPNAKLSFGNVVDTNGYDIGTIRFYDNGADIFYGIGVSSNQFNLRAGTTDDGFAFWAGNNHRMQIQATTGNVGIGTTSPGDKFHVEGGGIRATGGTSNGKNIRLYVNDSWGYLTTTASRFYLNTEIRVDSGLIGSYDESLQLRTSGTTRMYIDNSSGNVGIGTTNPGEKLDVVGGLAYFQQNAAAGSAFRWGTYGTAVSPDTMLCMNQLWNGSGWTILNSSYGTTYVNLGSAVSSPDISFGTGGANTAATTKMIIKNSGDVGIGTTVPRAKLDVNGNFRINTNNLELSNTPSWGVPTQNIIAADDNLNGATLTLMNTNADIPIGGPSGTIQFVALDDARNSGGSGYASASISVVSSGAPGTGNSGGGNILFKTQNSYSNLAERMRITSSGDVGIGTTSPSEKLHIGGKTYIESQGVNWNETTPGTARGALHFDPAGDGANNTGNAITFGASDTNAGANAQAGIYTRSDGGYGTKMYFATTNLYSAGSRTRMMINSNGNVGIGTTSPSQKLSVAPDTDVSAEIGKAHIGQVGFNDYAGFSHVDQNTHQGYALIQYSDGSTYMNANTGKNIRFRIGNSDKMTLNSSGNVGVGDTNPDAKLTVRRTDSTYAVNLSDTESRAGLSVTSSIYFDSKLTISSGASSRQYIQAVNNAATIGRDIAINPYGGNVGIGTTNMYARLNVRATSHNNGISVNRAADTTAAIYIGNDGGNNPILAANNADMIFGKDLSGTFTEYARIKNGGNVGIGQTNPSTYKLDVTGTIRATGDVIAYSDIRVKENIKTIDNAVEKVKALRGVEYNKIDNPEKSIGVIAQEIEEVIPEVVKEDDQGMKSVAYGNITAVLIEAIKEQQKQIDKLKNQLNAFTK